YYKFCGSRWHLGGRHLGFGCDVSLEWDYLFVDQYRITYGPNFHLQTALLTEHGRGALKRMLLCLLPLISRASRIFICHAMVSISVFSLTILRYRFLMLLRRVYCALSCVRVLSDGILLHPLQISD